MSFIKEYAEKLVTAEEAVKVVKSTGWITAGAPPQQESWTRHWQPMWSKTTWLTSKFAAVS